MIIIAKRSEKNENVDEVKKNDSLRTKVADRRRISDIVRSSPNAIIEKGKIRTIF